MRINWLTDAFIPLKRPRGRRYKLRILNAVVQTEVSEGIADKDIYYVFWGSVYPLIIAAQTKWELGGPNTYILQYYSGLIHFEFNFFSSDLR